MTDSSSELALLRQERQNTHQALHEGLRKVGSTWSWGIGNREARPRNIYPATVAITFIILTLALFVLGIVLILQHGTLASLGGPLIVGALFSASAFISQFWAVDLQRYLEVRRFAHQKEWDYLKKLAEREAELSIRINELESYEDRNSS